METTYEKDARMKVLVIVLSSIAGLIVLAIVAIAIAIPILHDKLEAGNTPAAQRATTSRIAEFVVPAGFKIGTAIDLGITQTATIGPIDRSKYSVTIQLTAQHLASAAQDKLLLDQMVSSVSFATKFRGCDLKPGPDETVRAAGKPVTLRTLSCPRDGVPLNVDLAIVHAGASTVQLVANDVRSPDDHAALIAFVRSMR